jgi:hypothetical protein
MPDIAPDALCTNCRPIPVALPHRPAAPNQGNSGKPQTFCGDLRNLPAALEPLTALPYWVLWKWVKKGDDWTKPPFQPSGRHAKNDDPRTWSTYDEVVAVVDQFDGIGLMLPEHAAFDLDKVRDVTTGAVVQWAQDLVAKSSTYAEISPSGKGLRIIGTAAGGDVQKKWQIGDGTSLEAYRHTHRYITVTGLQLLGTLQQLGNIDVLVDEVYAEQEARRDRARGGNGAAETSTEGSTSLPPMLAATLLVPDVGKGRPHGEYASRSELAFAFVTGALRSRVEDATIAAACLNGRYRGCAIFEHCRNQSNPQSYVSEQIKHAKIMLFDKEVADINKTHALVLAGNKAAIMKLEGKTRFRLLQISAFQKWFANQRIAVNGKMVSVADHWLSHRQRRQYEGIEFAPAGAQLGYYNLWRGFSVEPRAGDCSLFLDHIRDNVAQGDVNLYNWVVGWFAQIVQQPTEKVGTALCLRGKQGVGKTKVGQIVGSLFEDHYSLVADPRYIVGQFNAHMAQLLLLHADEAFWAGEKRAEGKLKDLVTGLNHFLEFKGIDPITVKNLIRLFVTGNQDWLVPAGFGERRFAVIDVGEEHKEDHPYFAAIDAQMNEGGREALLHYLLNFDLSTVNLRVIPKTEALLEQIIDTATPEQAWWLDTLKRGELPWGVLDPNTNNATCIKDMCPKRTLFRRYIQHANFQGVRRRAIEVKIGMFLNKYVGTDLKCDQKKKYSIYQRSGRRLTETGWVYTFPPLQECRQRFAKEMQQPIAWENADADWTHEAEQVEDEDVPF